MEKENQKQREALEKARQEIVKRIAAYQEAALQELGKKTASPAEMLHLAIEALAMEVIRVEGFLNALIVAHNNLVERIKKENEHLNGRIDYVIRDLTSA